MNERIERRFIKCMRQAQKGKELTIGFLGGSITQDSLATRHENCYAYQVFTWWKHAFPRAEFHYVNAGIGGTTSHFGVARVVSDLLIYQPDFVVIDFSVNDQPDTFYQETYEGIVRKILTWPSQPALLLLNNVFYDSGMNAQSYHNAIGDYYGVPHVSILDTVYRRMKAGEYTREEITPDGLHPNDKGHQLVAEEIMSFLEKEKRELLFRHKENTERNDSYEEDSALPLPVTENVYEDAKRLTICDTFPTLEGFRVDTVRKKGYLDHFKNGWIGEHPGDRIVFEVEASCIAVQYRKTIHKPAMLAQLILDNDFTHPILLDGNFEEDWGDCIYLEPILHHGESKLHTVEIRVMEGQSEKMEPFYLMSLIIA